jgi:hypothetical protein
MKSPNEAIAAQVGISITFLLSAMAMAASNRIMPPAPAKHGQPV